MNPFPLKSCSTTHLHVLLSNPMILKLPQNISYQWEERKWKINLKTAVALLNLKTSLKFCFLSMIKCWKLIHCIWNRRLCEVLNSQTAFRLFVARQWQENSLISIKKTIFCNITRLNWVKNDWACNIFWEGWSLHLSIVWETADHSCGQGNEKGYCMY